MEHTVLGQASASPYVNRLPLCRRRNHKRTRSPVLDFSRPFDQRVNLRICPLRRMMKER